MYYTKEKLEEIKQFSLDLYNEYRDKYKELWNSNHTFSDYLPVYSNSCLDHPASIGFASRYHFAFEDEKFSESYIKAAVPTLEKPEDMRCTQLCYYNKKTLDPFYSVRYDHCGRIDNEGFHRRRGNAVISSFYKNNGTLYSISAEIVDQEKNTMEYMFLKEEDQTETGISNGLSLDHAHFNFIGGHLDSIDQIEWFRPTVDIVPPYEYVSPFPEDSDDHELFMPNPISITNLRTERFDKRRLICHITDIATGDESKNLDRYICKEPFFRFMDIMNIKWYDHLR